MNHQIIEKLRELKPELKERFGMEEFAVFGSVAKDHLSEKLNKPADIGTFKSMKTFIKNRIKKILYMFDINKVDKDTELLILGI